MKMKLNGLSSNFVVIPGLIWLGFGFKFRQGVLISSVGLGSNFVGGPNLIWFGFGFKLCRGSKLDLVWVWVQIMSEVQT